MENSYWLGFIVNIHHSEIDLFYLKKNKIVSYMLEEFNKIKLIKDYKNYDGEIFRSLDNFIFRLTFKVTIEDDVTHEKFEAQTKNIKFNFTDLLYK